MKKVLGFARNSFVPGSVGPKNRKVCLAWCFAILGRRLSSFHDFKKVMELVLFYDTSMRSPQEPKKHGSVLRNALGEDKVNLHGIKKVLELARIFASSDLLFPQDPKTRTWHSALQYLGEGLVASMT